MIDRAASPPIRRQQPPTWRFLTMNDVRVILIGVGILTVGVGGLVLVNDIPPRQYPAIIGWLIAALIVHDVLIAGAVFTVALAGRRAGGRFSSKSIGIVQGALAVGAIVALLVIPEIVKQSIGTANPSVLPLDYRANLAIFLLALAVAVGCAIALHVTLRRQAHTRRLTR